MGIIKLAFVSLKKDMSKSIFYFLTFLLTTIFIFSFFNLTFNPYSGIHLGKDDTTFVTPIAVFVIVIAMLCVFLANNFYVSNRKRNFDYFDVRSKYLSIRLLLILTSLYDYALCDSFRSCFRLFTHSIDQFIIYDDF